RGTSHIDVNHLCGRESIEPRRRGVAVGADVLGINQILNLQRRQLLGLRDGIEAIARLTEHSGNLLLAALKRLQWILAVIKNNSAERMINAVVDVIAWFAVAHSFADDSRNASRRRCDQKSPRLGENLDIVVEQPVNLRVDD